MEPVRCETCGEPIPELHARHVRSAWSSAGAVTVTQRHGTCPPPEVATAAEAARRRAVRYSEFDEDEPEFERRRR